MVGARVKIVGLVADTIHASLTEAEVRQYAGKARKTALGHVVSTGTMGLSDTGARFAD